MEKSSCYINLINSKVQLWLLLKPKGKVLQPYEKLMWPALVVNNILKEERYIRVANVLADHDDLLTQWKPIKMS